MSLRSLLRKEVHWSKHNVLALAFLLILLPSFFAYTSVAFETVIPRDAPVAVVPQDEEVTDNDMKIIEGSLVQFSDPQVVESEQRARDMLRRESVYAIVTVPPNITDENENNATFRFIVDGSVVPFKEPSKAIRNIAAFQLDQALPADVSVQREVVAPESSLSEYLLSIMVMLFVILVAFTYVPYNLARERAVIDRLRAEASLESVLGAKLVYFTAVLAIPLVVFQAASNYLEYSIDVLAPGSVLALALTFVFLSALSMAVMVLFRFSTMGRFVNVVLLLGVIGFSGLGYPVGYFSTLRKTIVRLLPTHHTMIVARSAMLKGLDLSLFVDWLALLGGFTLATLVVLKLSAVYYRVSA
jgi:ABC-2 type transport system permease protein